ncbi:Transposable element Tc1 transposase [Folsomia candida]|uniref:Transposable element Tc1 transposase n=1 Tax=Folsomia candida TaxID=158441 RepID=A0A226CXE4_FOLCA|nr:Transposable element Tc1 transposase [Folsomia candida]
MSRWFEDKKVKTLPWALKSPDLSSNEHLWSEQQNKISNRSPSGKDNLKTIIAVALEDVMVRERGGPPILTSPAILACQEGKKNKVHAMESDEKYVVVRLLHRRQDSPQPVEVGVPWVDTNDDGWKSVLFPGPHHLAKNVARCGDEVTMTYPVLLVDDNAVRF